MNQRNRIFKNLLFCSLFLAIFVSSCEYEVIKPVIPELPPVDEKISFATTIEPIFAAKCVTCHTSRKPILTTSGAYNSLINDGYINTANPESSSLYIKIVSGHGRPTTPTENALILRWITEGAINN